MDLDFICHHLNVNLFVPPKKQPFRRSSKEYSDAVKEEMLKLKWAGTIKEVFSPEWLANANGGEEEKWKMESVCRLHGLK